MIKAYVFLFEGSPGLSLRLQVDVQEIRHGFLLDHLHHLVRVFDRLSMGFGGWGSPTAESDPSQRLFGKASLSSPAPQAWLFASFLPPGVLRCSLEAYRIVQSLRPTHIHLFRVDDFRRLFGP